MATDLPHESDLVKWNLFYRGTYEVVLRQMMPWKTDSGAQPTVLRSPHARCRFCGCTYARNFRKRAHVVPESLGNRHLLSRNRECDDCNSSLGESESHLVRMLGATRVLYGMRGKRGALKHKPAGQGIHVSRSKDHVRIESSTSVTPLAFDGSRGELLLAKEPYIPFEAFKALCKIVLTALPPELWQHFRELGPWLLEGGVLQPLETRCYETTLGDNWSLNGTMLRILRRKKGASVPFVTAQLLFANLGLQIFVPGSLKDATLTNSSVFPLPYPSVQPNSRYSLVDFKNEETVNELQRIGFQAPHGAVLTFSRSRSTATAGGPIAQSPIATDRLRLKPMDHLPQSLAAPPLLEAIYEIRFKSDTRFAGEVLPGLMFTKLGSRFGRVERLPFASIPQQAREANPDFQFMPSHRLVGDRTSIAMGDRVLTLNKSSYSGWADFSSLAAEVLEAAKDVAILDRVERFSFKCVNVLNVPPRTLDGDSLLHGLEVDLRIDDLTITNRGLQIRAQIEKDGFINLLEIIPDAVVRSATGEREGALLSIDTIGGVEESVDFWSVAADRLDAAHSTLKTIFFSLLTNETIESFGPEWG